MREWLSGGASPCQGEGRGFDPRFALFILGRNAGTGRQARLRILCSQDVGVRVPLPANDIEVYVYGKNSDYDYIFDC